MEDKLKAELASLREQEANFTNQVMMCRGAIQLCEHLIAECKETVHEENLQ